MFRAHVFLSASVRLGPLVPGVPGTVDRHRRFVKAAAPVWLYVLLSGAGVYGLLYEVFGAVP